MRPLHSNLLKALFALVALSVILWQIGIQNIYSAFSSANPAFIAAAFLLFVFVLFLNAANFMVLLSPVNSKSAGFLYIAKGYVHAWAVGLITPGRVGEFSMAYFLRKSFDVSKTVSIVLLERVITVSVLVLLSSGLILAAFGVWQAILVLGLVAASWAALIAFSLMDMPAVRRLAGYSETIRFFLGREKSVLFASITFVAARWLMFGVINYALLLSLGTEVEFAALIPVVAASTLISMIPVTIGGLGLREGSFVLLSSFIGIPPGIAGAAALLNLFVGYSVGIAALASLFISPGFKGLKAALNHMKTGSVPLR